jgi:hypothetical protein
MNQLSQSKLNIRRCAKMAPHKSQLIRLRLTYALQIYLKKKKFDTILLSQSSHFESQWKLFGCINDVVSE